MAWLHAVIDSPGALHAPSARWWAQALGWPLGEPWPDHPELRSVEPASGDAYVHLQQVDRPARVHLDLEDSDPRMTVDQAVAAGAQVATVSDRWVSLVSPGGLAFCVLQDRTRTAPPPVIWPDGHRSRLVQICIDSPVAAHDAEVDFWRLILPGRWVDSSSAEFAGKWHDDAGSPIQLLFQRLDEPHGPVRAHLDLGTDDEAAEVRRLVSLGAEDLGPGQGGWHVLRDPAGLPFCITRNPPDQTRHRELR